MNRLYILLIAGFVLSALTSCEDVLDKRNLNTVSDNIWEDEDMSTLYLNALYEDNMPAMALGKNSYMSDEAYSSLTEYSQWLYGLITDQDFLLTNAVATCKKENYILIREINIGIEGIQSSSLNDSIKGTLLGQALFLRAYRYFEMVKLHGGVPLVLSVQDPFYEELDVTRSSTKECFDQIVDDLDFAIEALPPEWDLNEDQGRLTSGAAAAFKGRVLLTWASPLFNRNNDETRWVEAYEANSLAIEILSSLENPRALVEDFSLLFTDDNIHSNSETVIARRYDASLGSEYASDWESKVRPLSANGDYSFNPTWNLVKAFPMANGKLIDDPSSGYDSTKYWVGRDPRFNQTIVNNGAEWKMAGRDFDVQLSYNRCVLERRRVPSSGFYCKKATNSKITTEYITETSTSWHELRYAEVLLNTSECANEIGEKSEALNYLRAIRERAGIDSGDDTYGVSDNVSKNELRELIMIERQIEFAFENKRFWDMRRRLMYREDLGEHVKKMNGRQRLGLSTNAKSARSTEASVEAKTFKLDDIVYEDYFTTSLVSIEGKIDGEVQSFNYLELYDFYPIHSSLVISSEAVKQTKGWFDGVFDPLAE